MSRARARRGTLVAIEGIDGAGKSTLQRDLARRWRARGWKVVLHREPADPELGREAQRLGARAPLLGALYFSLDRARARERVERALEQGAIVLQDRSYYSTLAYQGSALPILERVPLWLLQRHLTPEPDRVVWLDLPPAEALRRVGHRGGRRSPLERSRTLERVRRAYRAMARRPVWIRMDAAAAPAELAARTDRALIGYLRPRQRRRGTHRDGGGRGRNARPRRAG